MPSVFKKALSLLTGVEPNDQLVKMPKKRPFKNLTERELIQLESQIGSQLFGPIPEGHRRQFFNLDETTWIWYEEYQDVNGQQKTMTTRYEVQGKKIMKAQDGAQYSYIEGEELRNLTLAIQMYFEQVMRGVYRRDPATGKKLT